MSPGQVPNWLLVRRNAVLITTEGLLAGTSSLDFYCLDPLCLPCLQRVVPPLAPNLPILYCCCRLPCLLYCHGQKEGGERVGILSTPLLFFPNCYGYSTGSCRQRSITNQRPTTAHVYDPVDTLDISPAIPLTSPPKICPPLSHPPSSHHRRRLSTILVCGSGIPPPWCGYSLSLFRHSLFFPHSASCYSFALAYPASHLSHLVCALPTLALFDFLTPSQLCPPAWGQPLFA